MKDIVIDKSFEYRCYVQKILVKRHLQGEEKRVCTVGIVDNGGSGIIVGAIVTNKAHVAYGHCHGVHGKRTLFGLAGTIYKVRHAEKHRP